MVGRAVDTTVWSNAARNIPSMSAPMMMSTRRWGKSRAGSGTTGAVAVSVIAPLLDHRLAHQAPLPPRSCNSMTLPDGSTRKACRSRTIPEGSLTTTP